MKVFGRYLIYFILGLFGLAILSFLLFPEEPENRVDPPNIETLEKECRGNSLWQLAERFGAPTESYHAKRDGRKRDGFDPSYTFRQSCFDPKSKETYSHISALFVADSCMAITGTYDLHEPSPRNIRRWVLTFVFLFIFLSPLRLREWVKNKISTDKPVNCVLRWIFGTYFIFMGSLIVWGLFLVCAWAVLTQL